MIRNEREYRITKAAAQKFRDQLATGKPARAPGRAQVLADAARAQLADLERSLQEYDDLQSGKGQNHLTGSLEDLGALLIKARIARGWTQRELADRLGLKMQQIQQYESTEYEAASLTRLRDVARALGFVLDGRGAMLDLGSYEMKAPQIAAAKRGVHVHVSHEAGGTWKLKQGGQRLSTHGTQKDAVETARRAATESLREVVHGTDEKGIVHGTNRKSVSKDTSATRERRH